jgi:hypothetical protein
MTLIVEGGGRVGTIRATGALTLEAQGDATIVHSSATRRSPGFMKRMKAGSSSFRAV